MYEARQNKEKVSRRIELFDRKVKTQFPQNMESIKVVQLVRWFWNATDKRWESKTITTERPPNFEGYADGAVCITDDDVNNALTDEQLASGITSTDDNGKSIGPFNGGRGKIDAAYGPVFYDSKQEWCISRDYSNHAGGDTWKLFKKIKNKWERQDTLYNDGKRMYRG